MKSCRAPSLFTPFVAYACAACLCFALGQVMFPLFGTGETDLWYFEKRARVLISRSRHPVLAACFFKNAPIFDPELFENLRQAGLLHLTAISGGQVRLALDLAVQFPLLVFLHISRLFSATRTSVSSAQSLNQVIAPTLSGAVAFVFGMSGSLQRVWFLHYLINHKWLKKPALRLSTRFPHLSAQLIQRIAALCIIAAIFGNPWLNLSFLLSATGSGLASLVMARHHGKQDTLIIAFLKQTAMTSFLTALVLMPLSDTNIVFSVVANVICLPLVDVILVPIAMALFIGDRYS